MSYTDEERRLNAECSVIMGVQDDFATDIIAARKLVVEVERRAVRWYFIKALIEDIAPHGEHAAPDIWYMSHFDINNILMADPIDIARAFVKVLGS